MPTNEQILQLNKTIGCCRYLWNRMLGDHNTLYREIGIVPSNTPADYKNLEECIWLKEVDSLALANVQLNLNQAFKKFFNGEAKHPRFKKKKVCKDSFTTNNVSGNIRMEENGIRLPKLGILTLIQHRKIKTGGKLKSVTVCHEKDGNWYCSISFEYPKTEPVYPEPSENMKHIGLDMSAPHLYVDSNGELADFEKRRNRTRNFRRSWHGNSGSFPINRKTRRTMRSSVRWLQGCMRKSSISVRIACINFPNS